MGRDLMLCVDDGGTYVKAALVDAAGRQLALERERNVVRHPRPRAAEVDLEELWQVNCRLVRRLLEGVGEDAGRVAVVAVSGQGKGTYLVDGEGRPVWRGLTSSDARALPYVSAWKADGTDEALYGLVCQGSSAGKPQAQLRWIRDHEREAYDAARWVFSMKDYLNFRLTGVARDGMAAMSTTNLVNLRTLDYDRRLFEAYGIPEAFDKMPPLAWDTELVGGVTAEAARATGLAEGTPVAAGMFDVNASVLAMGVVEPGPVAMICGTHGVNVRLAREPVTDGSVKLNSVFSLPGLYQVEEGYPGSTGSLEWVLDQLFDRDAEEGLYERVSEMVAGVDPRDSRVVFLPLLSGWRDAKLATGAFLGLRADTGKAELLRAAYEGAALFHAVQMGHLLAGCEPPERIRMAGGATRSRVWVQTFADALQVPIEVVEGDEMGVRGLAITASVAAGVHGSVEEAVRAMVRPGSVVGPDASLADVYAEKLGTFASAIETMGPLWERLQ